MNIRSTFKTLPLAGVLILGFALSPVAAMADNSDRGVHRGQYSYDSGKSHKKTRKDDKQHKAHVIDRHGHKDKLKHHYGRFHADRRDHPHNRHVKHVHRDNHRHGYREHIHNYYVVNDHGHSHRYIDLDDLRFMIGLHTDQFDIILRD